MADIVGFPGLDLNVRNRAQSASHPAHIDAGRGGRHIRASLGYYAGDVGYLGMLKQLFIWWDRATIGTSFTLWRRGARLIGKDDQGNRYFEEKEPSSSDGRLRRWVIYHGVAEGSRVPADWHGWMHHTFAEPPTVSPLNRRAWEKDHLPNMTGTPLAYRPQGSLELPEEKRRNEKGYEAWSPDGG